MEEIETLCKRVFILDLGEEVAYGTKEEVKKTRGAYTNGGSHIGPRACWI